MISHCLKLLLAAAIALAPAAHAFVPPVHHVTPQFSQATNKSSQVVIITTRRSMSDNPRSLAHDEQLPKLGATERLLLERKYQQDAGLVQEYGRTIKKDGLDSVRAAVWALFHVSQNIVFPALGVALVVTLALNMAGYGYYVDTQTGNFHLDTMHHIAQMRLLEDETARFAAGTETMMR